MPNGHPRRESGCGTRPLAKPGIDAAALLRRWKKLPRVNANEFRRDVDELLDASL